MVKLNTNPPELSAAVFDLPKDYILAPKGNVYITKHCRAKTRAACRPVFVVHNHENQTLGIGVPHSIHEEVLALSEQTAGARAEAVKKKDSALERKTEVEIMKQFPKIPREFVPAILKHMLQKHSGRVGRTSEPLKKVVALGVRAHVRHKYTDYDKLLRGGIAREEARSKIRDVVEDKVREWGGKPWSGGGLSKSTSLKTKTSGRRAMRKRKVAIKLVTRPKRHRSS